MIATILIIVSLLASAPAAAVSSGQTAGPLTDPAHLAFERFKALAGTWQSKSTKGWTEDVTYSVMGNGSFVLEVTHLTDSSNDGMATIVHLDGSRLMMTHYCEAKNQPRLVAREIASDGSTVTFDFLDATNLTRPGAGHMHRVKVHFIDADHFTSQWIWQQDGEDKWMEEIAHQRVR